MSFPKKGKVFPNPAGIAGENADYSTAMGQALRQELGGTNQAIKALVRWTGTNERTAKNWMAGKNGPSGEHLIALMRNSDVAFRTVLCLAGRKQALMAEELGHATEVLAQIVELAKALTKMGAQP